MRKRNLFAFGVAILAVAVVVGIFEAIFLTTPPSPLFTVAGKQQPTESLGGGYQVTSWNFTFAYNGEKALQNVNLYLNDEDMAFKSVPEVTEGWIHEYIWTPGDIAQMRQ